MCLFEYLLFMYLHMYNLFIYLFAHLFNIFYLLQLKILETREPIKRYHSCVMQELYKIKFINAHR